MDDSCDICRIVANPKNVLFETTHWLIMLANDQGYLGRSYITLKNHRGHLSELTKQEWAEYAEIVERLEKAVTAGLNATLFNWSCLVNNAYQKQPASPHIHWHFRPRYRTNQTIDATVFNDPYFGYHYDREQRVYPEDAMLQVIANKIRGALT